MRKSYNTTLRLRADAANEVEAPLIGESYVNFECRLREEALVDRYNFFVFAVA